MPKKEKGWNLASLWKDYKPPGRPSESEVKIFEECIKKYNPKSALVLGSTPEFRSLLHKYNIATTVVDYNKETYDILTKLVKNKGKEIFIANDWRKIPTTNNYDLIVGDLSLNCLPKEDISKMITLFDKLLSKNGLVIQRIVIRKNNKKKSINQIIKEYRQNKKQSIWESIWFDIQMNQYNFDKEYVLFSDSIKELKKANKSGLISDQEFAQFSNKGWENLDKFNWFIPNINFIKKEIKKKFNIISIKNSKDIFSKDMPLFVFSKEFSQ
jgi:hypothetical protein